MKVWLLSRSWHYQGDEVIGVYASEGGAKDALELAERISDTTCSIKEWEVKK